MKPPMVAALTTMTAPNVGLKHGKVVPGVGKVSTDEILKGYALGDNEYLLIQPEEIDAIKLETKKTFELVQFVGTNEISPLYYDQPYYIVPADELAEDAYRVVRDALRKSEKTGLGQLTLHGREHLCAVRPCGDGLGDGHGPVGPGNRRAAGHGPRIGHRAGKAQGRPPGQDDLPVAPPAVCGDDLVEAAVGEAVQRVRKRTCAGSVEPPRILVFLGHGLHREPRAE